MKWLIGLVLAIIMSSTLTASFYKLENVKRIDNNLYSAGYSPKYIVETKYCHYYAYSETAIYNDSNDTILWQDNSTCDVVGIYRR